jgi:hypothetical protein
LLPNKKQEEFLEYVCQSISWVYAWAVQEWINEGMPDDPKWEQYRARLNKIRKKGLPELAKCPYKPLAWVFGYLQHEKGCGKDRIGHNCPENTFGFEWSAYFIVQDKLKMAGTKTWIKMSRSINLLGKIVFGKITKLEDGTWELEVSMDSSRSGSEDRVLGFRHLVNGIKKSGGED